MGILDAPSLTKVAADKQYAAIQSGGMFGASRSIAPHVAFGLDTVFYGTASNPLMAIHKHRIYWPSADLRMVVAPGNIANDVDNTYAHLYAASILVGGIRYPLTFRGLRQVVVHPGGYAISDPLPVEVAMSAAQDIYSYLYTAVPLGSNRTLAAYRSDSVTTTSGSSMVTDTSITAGDFGRPVTGTGIPANSFVGTVTAGASFLLSSASGSQVAVNASASGTVTASLGYKAGDTTINLSTAPDQIFTATLPHSLSVNSSNTGGSTEEAVTVTAVSATGTALTISALVRTFQPVGAVVAQKGINNSNTFTAEGDAFEQPGTDKTVTGSASALTSSTAALTSAAAIGDTKIKFNGKLYGTQYTIDAETVNVRTVTGTASPYTGYLTAPLTANHNSGATVTGPGYNHSIGPVAILADKTSAPAGVVALGDSITTGAGYNTRMATSFASLALEGQRPYHCLGKSSELLSSTSGFLSPANRKRRSNYLSLANGGWVICAYGRNDIGSARTLAALQADIATLLALVHRRGAKLAVCTITPNTTSTDDWQTTANQTVVNITQDAVRASYNDWLRGGTSGVDAVFDTAGAVESGLNSGLWRADASGPYSADGTHPTKPGHEAMAAAINVALLT